MKLKKNFLINIFLFLLSFNSLANAETLTFGSSIYEGEVNESNQPKGKGIGYPTETIICDGNWSRGSLNGESKVQHNDNYYEGVWKYGKLSKLTLVGLWKNNKLTILKDKKDIEKEKYKPFNFTYGRILWILNLKEDW